VTRPAVIPEPRPDFQYALERCLCQVSNGGKDAEEAAVIRDYRSDLGLLEHDL
jgi:hypothetical protein